MKVLNDLKTSGRKMPEPKSREATKIKPKK
jgi:hypothetical protein